MTEQRPESRPGLFWRLFKDPHFDHCSQFLGKDHIVTAWVNGILVSHNAQHEKTWARARFSVEEVLAARCLLWKRAGSIW